MTRRRTRYRSEEPHRFSQLEPGGPPPDAVFSPTYDKPADYSHLISPVHRRLGWRLRGYYIPEGTGVAAKVLLDVPNPDPRYADSLWCGKVFGDGHAHWLGLYKRNRALPRAPRETEYELGYGPRVDVWDWRFHDRGLAHAARNYLTAALGDLVARFRRQAAVVKAPVPDVDSRPVAQLVLGLARRARERAVALVEAEPVRVPVAEHLAAPEAVRVPGVRVGHVEQHLGGDARSLRDVVAAQAPAESAVHRADQVRVVCWLVVRRAEDRVRRRATRL
jgi:hypothetical protein